MTIPLIVLAVLSALGGLLGIPEAFRSHAHLLHNWLHPLLPEMEGIAPGSFAIPHTPELAVMVISTLVALAGWWMARSMYRDKALAADERMEKRSPGLVSALSNKYWVDEFYDSAVVTPLRRISVFSWRVIDAIIDGLLSLLGYVTAAFGDLMRFIQTGNVRNYALMLFLGVVVFIWVWV
jgi:NADH-quinone oxidoreductase subunit L